MSKKIRKFVSVFLIFTLVMPTAAFAVDLPQPLVEEDILQVIGHDEDYESVYMVYASVLPTIQTAELAAMF